MIIFTILIVLFILLMTCVLSSCLTLFGHGHQGDFARVYKDLPNRKFYLNVDQVYSHKYNESDDSFIWFTNSNSFCISQFNYLHNKHFTYFSPFHLYWLIKYQRWFKKNIDIKSIEKF